MPSKPSLSQAFANALCDNKHFSPESIDKATYCLLDFLTCVFSTQQYPWVKQAQQVALQNSATQTEGAALIGTPMKVSPQDAAFANAVAGHSLVRDDMHLGSVSHLGVVVVPAALALASRSPVSGRQFLEALVCGYEAGGKLGAMLMDVNTARKFRPTGMIGAFAAAATCARLQALDSTQTGNALGFAANYITGLNEWAAWGSDDMYFHPGIAARNGMTAALLASAGATAATGSLDGNAGLFAALGKSLPDPLNLPFTTDTEIQRVFFKQVPACNYAQTAAQVARIARQELAGDPDQVTQISIRVPHAAAHYPGCDYPGPFSSILQARMSIHFNIASALINGDFHDSHFRDFANTAVANLAQKVTVEIDENLTAAYPALQGAAITVTGVSGESVSSTLDDVEAATSKEVETRFSEAVSNAIGKDKAKTLLATVLALDANSAVEELLALLDMPP